MKRMWLALMLATTAAGAAAQDYAREERWRSEVMSGLVAGEAVQIPGPGNRPFLGLLTEPANAQRAGTTLLVIVHGTGVHPDHSIIGRLRMDLVDKGFATLAIQMPVLAGEATGDQYAPVFPDAVQRIAGAAAWARQQGFRDRVLVSHSLGSRMANAYFDSVKQPDYRAWVALGLGGDFTPAFAKATPVAVLDVYGERDLAPVLAGAAARAKVAAASGARQQVIGGADHFFAGREPQLVAAVAEFAARR